LASLEKHLWSATHANAPCSLAFKVDSTGGLGAAVPSLSWLIPGMLRFKLVAGAQLKLG
jgi:hypothetical protein